MSDTQETDVSACIHHAKETPYDDWVYAGHAKLIARERDTMKAERNQFMNALNRVKKELAAANKGAETNAKVNQILCKKLSEAESERDEARRKLEEARKALRWIAGRYCYEKTTVALANEAYEMSSTARWTLQELEKKEEA